MVLAIYSCEKTITVDIPDEGRKIVINSLYDANGNFGVALSQSKYILETGYEFKPINNASILLYENNQLIETLTEESNGYYYSVTDLKQGNTYKLEAKADNWPMASCESRVPYEPKIDTTYLSVIYDVSEYYSGIRRIDFDLKFQDDGLSSNYYMLRGEYKTRQQFYNTTTGEIGYDEFLSPFSIYTNSQSNSNSSSDFDNYHGGIVFDDVLFNGKLHNLNFYTEYLYTDFTDSPDSTIRLYYYLSEISEDLYKYYLSYEKYQLVNGDPFSEPVQVFSNIKNGFGIFGGRATAVDSSSFKYGE